MTNAQSNFLKLSTPTVKIVQVMKVLSQVQFTGEQIELFVNLYFKISEPKPASLNESSAFPI